MRRGYAVITLFVTYHPVAIGRQLNSRSVETQDTNSILDRCEHSTHLGTTAALNRVDFTEPHTECLRNFAFIFMYTSANLDSIFYEKNIKI